MMPKLTKDQLRKQVVTKLAQLTEQEKVKIEKMLLHHLVNSSVWKEAQTIGITCSTKSEWDTYPIIEKAWEEGKVVAVPKTIPKQRVMLFYRIDSFSHLEEGHHNLIEPIPNKERYITKDRIDLILVPGLVFDKRGYRIGFGGGYYDRFLKDYSGITVSLLSRLQLVKSIPIEKHDLHVQYVITESGIEKVTKQSEV